MGLLLGRTLAHYTRHVITLLGLLFHRVSRVLPGKGVGDNAAGHGSANSRYAACDKEGCQWLIRQSNLHEFTIGLSIAKVKHDLSSNHMNRQRNAFNPNSSPGRDGLGHFWP
eukprot:scaffold14781_cov48-Prasinocladus_malaysianus.AAC.1